MLLSTQLGSGLVGQTGPSLKASGVLAVGLHLTAGLHGRLLLGVGGGPLGSADPWTIQLWSLAPGLGGVYLFPLGPVDLGVTVGVQALWTHLSIAETSQRFSAWSIQVSAGLELHWRVRGAVSVTLGAGLSTAPRRVSLELRSSGETLVTTPFLSWFAQLGVALKY